MTEQDLKVYLADTLSITRFQETLNAETEEGKYEILKRLLVEDFRKIEKIVLL